MEFSTYSQGKEFDFKKEFKQIQGKRYATLLEKVLTDNRVYLKSLKDACSCLDCSKCHLAEQCFRDGIEKSCFDKLIEHAANELDVEMS